MGNKITGLTLAKALWFASSVTAQAQLGKFGKKMTSPEEKKNFAVELTRKYSPEIYPFVKAHDGTFMEYYFDNDHCDGYHITDQIGILAHESAHTFVKYMGPSNTPRPTEFVMQ